MDTPVIDNDGANTLTSAAGDSAQIDAGTEPDAGSDAKQDQKPSTSTEHHQHELEAKIKALESEKQHLLTLLAQSSDQHAKASGLEVDDTHPLRTAPGHLPASIMSLSTGSEESAVEDEKFVKIKPCEMESGSSKASSQSGKENLELEETIHALNDQLDAARKSLIEKEEECKGIKHQLEAILLEKNVESRSISSLSSDVKSLKVSLDAKDEQMDEVHLILDDLLEQFKGYLTPSDESSVQDAETLEGKLSALKCLPQQFRGLEQSLAEAQADLKGLQDEQSDIIGGYQLITENYEKLQAEFEEYKLQQEDESNLQLKTEIERFREELLSKDEDLMEIQSRCDEFESLMTQKGHQLESLQNEYLKLKSTAEEAEARLSAAEEVEARLSAAESASSDFSSRCDEFQRLLEKKDLHIEHLEAEYSDFQTTMKSALKAAAEEMASTKSAMLDIQSRCDEYQNESTRRSQELEALEVELRELRAAAAAPSAPQDVAESETAIAEVQSLKDTLAQKSRDLDTLKIKFIKYRKATEERTKEAKEAVSELAELRLRCTEFEAIVSQKEEELQSLRNDFEQYRSEAEVKSLTATDVSTLEELKSQCEKYEELLSNTNSELESLEKDFRTESAPLREQAPKVDKSVETEVSPAASPRLVDDAGSSSVVTLQDRCIEELRKSKLEQQQLMQSSNEAISRNSELAALNSELSSRNTVLVSQNSELISKNSELSSRNSELEAENCDILSKISELSSENSTLSSNNSELSSENSELCSRNSELSSKIFELSSKNSALESQDSDLFSRHSTLEAENLHLVSKNSAIEAENINLISKYSALEVENSNLISKNSELSSKNAELTAVNSQLVLRTLELESQNSEFLSKFSDFQNRISAQETELSAKEEALEDLRSEIQEIRSCVEIKTNEINDTVNSKNKEIERLMTAYQSYAEAQEKMEAELTEVINSRNEVIGHLQNDLEVTKRNQEVTRHEQEEILSQAQEQIDSLQNYLSVQNAELQKLSDAESVLSERVKAQEINITELAAQLREKEQKINVLVTEVAEVSDLRRREVIELKSELSRLGDLRVQEVNDLQSRLSQLTILKSTEADDLKVQLSQVSNVRSKEVSDLRSELMTLTSRASAQERELNHLRSIKDTAREEYANKLKEDDLLRESELLQLQHQLDSKTQDLAIAESCLSEATTALETLTSQNGLMQDENAALKNQLDLTESQLLDLASQIKFKEEQVNDLESKVTQLRSEMTTLEAFVSEQEARANQAEEALNSQKLALEDTVASAELQGMMQVAEEQIETLRAEIAAKERKTELLQSKITEIETSEMKAFEESFVLKNWIKQLEFENQRFQDEVNMLLNSATKDPGVHPKIVKIQEEALRLIYALDERDKRCVQLTLEITRLLEERDELQLKLSSVLKHNVELSSALGGTVPLTPAPVYDKKDLEQKLAQLEDTNFRMHIDLKREREARKLVQEELLYSQAARMYRDREMKSRLGDAHPPNLSPSASNSSPGSRPLSPETLESLARKESLQVVHI